MTNKEKIEEIVIDAFEGWSKVGFTYEEMIAILSKLAEWKDKQFKEYLEKKLVDIRKEKTCGPYGVGYNLGEQRIVNEIINELPNINS